MEEEEHNTTACMSAVTISREYGSGGGEIAARLAKRLGWQLIDHEIVERVAQELGVSEAEAEAHDERVESALSRILISMQAINPSVLVAAPAPLAVNTGLYLDAQSYHEAVSRVVEAAVALGQVVIIGRGGQMLLRQRRDVLHVRIVAALAKRIAYVMHREGLDEGAARSRIQIKDHDRLRYLQERYRERPDNPCLYDLTVSTTVLDLDSVVDIIQLALQRKGARLAMPEAEVGPGAGMTRYPGQPADFRSSEQAGK